MKRNTLMLTAAAIGLSALAATASFAHGTGSGAGNGQGMMQGQGQGMMQGHGHGYGAGQQDCLTNKALETPLTVDDVRTNLEAKLEQRGNDRLKVGEVIDMDDKTITAEIVTVDNSLVRTIQIDKASGRRMPVQ